MPVVHPADVWRRTPVGTTYDIFGSERYVLTYQNRAFRDIAAWAPYEFVTILVNSATYGGGGLYNVYSTAAVDSAWAEYLFVHEFAHHSVLHCAWARAFYANQRARGHTHHAAVRALAFKWIRILWRCWMDRTPYDDARYVRALAQRGSPVAATLATAA